MKIAFGTDAGVHPHGWNARQFAYMVKWGMTPMQAIQAATVKAADLLGWAEGSASSRRVTSRIWWRSTAIRPRT